MSGSEICTFCWHRKIPWVYINHAIRIHEPITLRFCGSFPFSSVIWKMLAKFYISKNSNVIFWCLFYFIAISISQTEPAFFFLKSVKIRNKHFKPFGRKDNTLLVVQAINGLGSWAKYKRPHFCSSPLKYPYWVTELNWQYQIVAFIHHLCGMVIIKAWKPCFGWTDEMNLLGEKKRFFIDK